MPAVIFGNRFRGRGVPAWHHIGRVFNDDPTALEAMKEADMLYSVEKTPVYADIAGGRVEVPGKYAVVRGATLTDDAAFVGIVGKEYEPIQNEQVATAIDRSGLLASGQYQVETVGALGDGERIFMALSDRTGEFSIAGSPARNYWTVYNGHDGNLALGLMQTPVKVVCSNTLVMALDSSSINVKVQHTKAAELDLEFWLNLAPRMRAAEAQTREVIANMVAREVTDEEVDNILAAAYPTPKEVGKAQLHALKALLQVNGAEAAAIDKAFSVHERNAARQLERAAFAKDIFANYLNTEEKLQAGTLWGVVEAVAEAEDFRLPSRVSEDQWASALFGPRARVKREAMTAALPLVGVKQGRRAQRPAMTA